MPEDPAAQPAPDDAAGTVVVLTEEALGADDAARIAALHAETGVVAPYRVLVPADTERSLLANVVDHLSLFELREALATIREGQPDPQEARADADAALAASLAALRGTDHAVAGGEVVADDPLPALQAAVDAGGVHEVVVVTRPHAVEDTVGRDWASRARDHLGVPVLHVYAGTAHLG